LDGASIVGNVDFALTTRTSLFEKQYFLWAEAKKGKYNIFEMFTQLVLTIGKARTFDKHDPPPFLAVFDAERIAFVPYSDIQHFFYQNDFNWNVAPSNHLTKEFIQVNEQIRYVIREKSLLFEFGKDEIELREFIKKNIKTGNFAPIKKQIDKNNFVPIYNKWLEKVKPTIRIDWIKCKQDGITDGKSLSFMISLANTTDIYIFFNFFFVYLYSFLMFN
jgi:hypothetical protein